MTRTYDFFSIDGSGALPGRPFTTRALALQDLASMNEMARRLQPLLMACARRPPHSGPFALTLPSARGREMRVIVCDLDRLLEGTDVWVVGFFGDRRPGAESAPVEAVDAGLIEELGAFPQALCYCSFELEDGNYGNLVLLSDDAGREHWRASRRHQYAAGELAPGYYLSVRLHNGVMPGGLASGQIRLTRTKYFDYRDGLWCGVREFSD